MIVSGKAVLFGDNINTDIIIPSKYLTSLDPNELAKHAMESIDPSFPNRAKEGVIIVAGRNFGCGSSREQAPLALKYAGVNCIIAESFARIFFRNAINIGLPILEAAGTSGEIDEGDVLKIILEEGKIIDETKGRVFSASRLPGFILEIIRDGGLIEHLVKALRSDRS
ncbi:MAG: 3-isopropylmalate dehydratase small subunit [Candidatus Bathyarchaeia archaeon]|nr:3-isopropylmalate dehydratase small subunit [Candidatus Bathyarchaeota archaeon]